MDPFLSFWITFLAAPTILAVSFAALTWYLKGGRGSIGRMTVMALGAAIVGFIMGLIVTPMVFQSIT